MRAAGLQRRDRRRLLRRLRHGPSPPRPPGARRPSSRWRPARPRAAHDDGHRGAGPTRSGTFAGSDRPGQRIVPGPDHRDTPAPPRPRLGRDPTRTRPRPGHGGHDRGARPRSSPLLRRLRRARGPQPRRRARAARGLLPPLRPPRSRSWPSCIPASSSPASTRWPGASPTAGWVGSTWPRTARRRPVGGPQGPDQHGRRGRHGGGAGRAALPGRGRAPQHREDPQLRRARRRRLHRHGVRRTATACASVLEARRAANGDRPDPLPVDQAIAYVLEILPALGHLHDLGLLFCDFKPDNVIRTPDSVKLIDLGGVYRMDDDEQPGLRHRRLPGARDRRDRPHRGIRSLHRGADPRRAVHRLPRVPGHATATRCRRLRDVPLFAEHDSLYRFLQRATAGRAGRPLPDGRRDGRAARGRPPRGRGHPTRIPGSRREHLLHRRAPADGGDRGLAQPARAAGRPGRSGRRRPRVARRYGARRRARGPGWPGRARAGEPRGRAPEGRRPDRAGPVRRCRRGSGPPVLGARHQWVGAGLEDRLVSRAGGAGRRGTGPGHRRVRSRRSPPPRRAGAQAGPRPGRRARRRPGHGRGLVRDRERRRSRPHVRRLRARPLPERGG